MPSMIDVMNRCYWDRIWVQLHERHSHEHLRPADNYSIQGGHVVPGLIHKCPLAKKNGTPFEVWGTGSPLRQFIYSGDLTALTVWVLRSTLYRPVILSPEEKRGHDQGRRAHDPRRHGVQRRSQVDRRS